MEGNVDGLSKSAYPSVHQKASERGACSACLCVVTAAFAGAVAMVLPARFRNATCRA